MRIKRLSFWNVIKHYFHGNDIFTAISFSLRINLMNFNSLMSRSLSYPLETLESVWFSYVFKGP